MKKQLYTLLFLLGSCFAAVDKANAQCPCANGDAPDSTVHTFTLLPTSDFSSAITFPKFSPSTGTLNCISLVADITAVANLGIRNRDSLPRDYEFLYTQAIGISGPGGLSSNANTQLTYGPTSLDAYGMPNDSVHYGPDTPFKHRKLIRTISNVSPYLGTGNVTLNFTNTGSTLLLQGSNNYQATITTFAWGEFRLVYYWCHTSLLASGIKSFNVARKDQLVLLQWSYENEPAATAYEIQLSRDGQHFEAVGRKDGNTVAQTLARHQQEYLPAAGESKLYFRVKAIRPGGGEQYSAIRSIDVSKDAVNDYLVSPNPVKKNASIAFTRPQTGDFSVEIINTIGQPVYRKMHSLKNETLLEIYLPQQQAPGYYYLRINNTRTKEQLVKKILLQ
ncbi:MAG TPA: choice-of-anchor E domain-containing protein [Chitinophagaceae bacterium]|nr:choice-of-anchor E domain-containing protein [Chitinophagaceae bacterium]